MICILHNDPDVTIKEDAITLSLVKKKHIKFINEIAKENGIYLTIDYDIFNESNG